MSKRILIADDDTAILYSVKLMLEDEGYTVDTTLSGADVKNLSSDLPAVVVLDIWLAGSNGRDICTYLKHQEKTRNLPIILFSANRDIERIAQEAGADDFLLKPFDIDELINKLQPYVS